MATTQPAFSSSYDPVQGEKDLAPLLERWALIPSGRGIERSFHFKTFKKTWEWMNIVAEECKKQKHHPEWSNLYNTAFVRWTTHAPAGLSEKDVIMARFCDEKAMECGEVEVVKEGGEEGEAKGVERELVERVVGEGGDCCVPKGARKEV